MYNPTVIKHFRSPHNVGEIKNPDGIGKVGNPLCGDIMWIYIKVGKDKNGTEILKKVKFKTFGCVAAIATSSMLTDLAIGMSLDQAMKLTRDDIAKNLKGLPPIKMHCSNLAAEGLHKAIKDYRSKRSSVKIKKNR